ncbi:NAD(P)H-binding protein [Cronobacter turicensis]|uniref:NAD(P)H-binding protein n=1 Tax=Cronobacter turicensis TaxID=413502 RepID=UPI0014126BE3|nr:NAD(P)H-binding protein [Cronobacter turicensis]NHV10473.1 NAD(P)H-binding protein [Cronobacter turicensis]NHV64498.1 NAD(P)H-binding protein [Cronobacter turicensis]NHW11439.1 NAD(P)H-binding protein [Cronobacter turicensis]
MSRVLITGASGLVGGHLLRMLVDEPRVSSIIAPTRRPLRVPMHKVENPCDPQLSDVLTQLSAPLDIVFCCLGTTRREAGSKEAFILADYTLVVDTSLAGLRLGAKHMLVVSALGANPNSPFFYNRVKGEMETALKAQGWPRLTIVRPSLLIGDREKRRAGESFMAPLFRLLPGKWKAIEAQTVAQAMVNAALSPAKEDVALLDSAQLREIAAQTAR